MKKFLLFFLFLFFFLLFSPSVYAVSGTFEVTGGYVGSAWGARIIGGNFSPDASSRSCKIEDSLTRFYNALTDSTVGTSWDSCQFSTPGSTVGVYSRDLPDGDYYVVLADYGGDTWTSQTFSIVNDQIVVLAPTPTPTPGDQSPSINAISNAVINEGDAYLASGSFTDFDSTSWTATVDYGDGSGVQQLTLSGTNFSLSHVYIDNGIHIVTVSVTDNQGATGTGTAIVTVNNISPIVGAITVSPNPAQVNTAISANITFTDSDTSDTHTAVWNWGDNTTSTGAIMEDNGSGSVVGTHIYTNAGIYTVSVTVTDNHGASGAASYNSITVYDPNAGSITGFGSFNSQAGAYLPNSTSAGQLKFNIKAQYKGNNTVPGGKINLDFKKANFSFDSTSLQWMVINGNRAQLKGIGKINGLGNYNIFISILDLSKKGNTDKIRIKITDSSSNLIYDNQQGSSNIADPTTPITRGFLKIHH